MKDQSTAVQPAKAGTPVKLVPVSDFFDRIREIFEMIEKRAYETFEARGRVDGHHLEDWLRAESDLVHALHLEVSESEGEVTVRAEVPGFSANELQVSVDPQRLTIKGRREASKERKDGKTIFKEQCADQVCRVLDLPTEVDPSKAKATLKDGILEISMPKVVVARKIRVQQNAP